MEVLCRDIPSRHRSLKLGDCPHGVPMVQNPISEGFAENPHLYCGYQREAGRDTSSHSRDLEAWGKVSVLWGLVEASASYSQHDTTNRSNNSLTLQSTCRIQKGTLSLQTPKVMKERRCRKDICKKATYFVNTICIGGEASLTVQLDSEQDSSRSSSTSEGGVKVFGSSFSKDIGSYANSYSGTCSVYAEYSSPFYEDKWVLKRTLTSESDIDECVEEVEKKEQEMEQFAEKVRNTDINALHYKYVFMSSAPPSSGVNMIDTRVKVGSILKELGNVLEEAGPDPSNNEMKTFVNDVRVMVTSLKNMMKSGDIDMETVNTVYGQHAPNYYRRKLKRLQSA
ncbi:uncharacterized protein LOC124135435 [Haliotis rufescens]|uniref:uncharacterized protein LOC124135435 n=1 Tax=Haliotis rufescens TaxID=6454 RepID=UPI00201FA46D|nr:uncharacterized protein LOC124135435 [Haliotis rufescens]